MRSDINRCAVAMVCLPRQRPPSVALMIPASGPTTKKEGRLCLIRENRSRSADAVFDVE
jgi:hypothetical protein